MWIVLGGIGVLALCLLLVLAIARGEARLQRNELVRRARRELSNASRRQLLEAIDGKLAALKRELAEVRASAGAYSAVGNAAGAAASLHVEMEQLEQYRRVVATMPDDRSP